MPPPQPGIFVRIGLPTKDGAARAQIVVGSKATKLTPLSAFSQEIREKFENPTKGQTLQSRPPEPPALEALTPQTIRPLPGATVQSPDPSPDVAQRQRHPRGQPTAGGEQRNLDRRMGPQERNADTSTLIEFQPDGEHLGFSPHPTHTDGRPRRLTVDSLKVADRFVAVRRNASFTLGRETTLVAYAQDVVSMGLSNAPDIDDNPYNFVPWIGYAPYNAESAAEAAHDKERKTRLSGRLTVIFTARTPIFVPEGQLKETDSNDGNTSNRSNEQDFFHCWDGKCDRYAIPGASVKGAIRSLFEALTNSRAGVTDHNALEWPPLYRRRSSRLFKIVSMPNGNVPGKLQECTYGLCDGNGTPCETRRHERERMRATGYDNSHSSIEMRDWRANLFWVGSQEHQHGQKKRIRFHPMNKPPLNLSDDTVYRFESMQGHPHLRTHPANASAAAKPAYNGSAPPYSKIEKRLFDLDVGDIVFGIPNRGRQETELQCFGKNVNFLWPGAKSPLEMMDDLAEPDPQDQQLSTSDPAQVTFGFAGKHSESSHSFRGRVRFNTFWGPCVTDNALTTRGAVQLMPLTSPSGTKAKARPLYLEPRRNNNPRDQGESADCDDSARLRGRKFYWHQKSPDGNIPGVHRLDALKDGTPASWQDGLANQLPDPIKPLPVGTSFKGAIHFSNLTRAELGALLVAVKPDLAFADTDRSVEVPAYGIKLGKGKPRGLGSVTADIDIELAATPKKRYACFGAKLTTAGNGDDVEGHVDAYKRWLDAQMNGNGQWSDTELAKALRVLLKISQSTSVRAYPPQFNMYGWLPDLNDPHGAPRGQRPNAMTPAYKLKGP